MTLDEIKSGKMREAVWLKKYNAKLLGMVINPLYLYQPEFF